MRVEVVKDQPHLDCIRIVRVEDLADKVGLPVDLLDRFPHQLSGGQKARVGIARAIALNPDLLILDEPAAALDPMGRHDVLEVMERLQKHTTIFYSTHILDDVQRVSDTVAILAEGRVVAQGPISELLTTPTTAWTVRLVGEAE